MSELTNAIARSRSPGAIRQKLFRDRQKDGVRCARIRMSEAAMRFLVDGHFLAAGQCRNEDIEAAVYAVFNAAKAAGVTRYGVLLR